MESNGMKFLAPFQGQDLTDIALHFKWTRRDGGDTEFILEMADNVRFADANVMEAAILEDAEVGYYFPKKDELPAAAPGMPECGKNQRIAGRKFWSL